MFKLTDTAHAGLKLVAFLAVAALATGCASGKGRIAAPGGHQGDHAAPSGETPVVESTPVATKPSKWAVSKGESLWGIAGHERVYNLPESWPVIYKANLEKIDDADLIFPGQVLDIPRELSNSDIDAAVNHAKTRGAWSLEAVESSDRAYLRDN